MTFDGLGIGIVMAIGNVEMNKAIPLDSAGGEGQLNITGNAFNVGVNFGIMVEPVKGLSLGLDYRSKINMFVDDGDAEHSQCPAAVHSEIQPGGGQPPSRQPMISAPVMRSTTNG
ncbi:MAG: hypothetical protein MZV70_66980 [Desulfobacterales bacterium]|nr:hypothetical protein [Desulfobacterales bacterium]